MRFSKDLNFTTLSLGRLEELAAVLAAHDFLELKERKETDPAKLHVEELGDRTAGERPGAALIGRLHKLLNTLFT